MGGAQIFFICSWVLCKHYRVEPLHVLQSSNIPPLTPLPDCNSWQLLNCGCLVCVSDMWGGSQAWCFSFFREVFSSPVVCMAYDVALQHILVVMSSSVSPILQPNSHYKMALFSIKLMEAYEVVCWRSGCLGEGEIDCLLQKVAH